jgi:hypothetical protein
MILEREPIRRLRLMTKAQGDCASSRKPNRRVEAFGISGFQDGIEGNTFVDEGSKYEKSENPIRGRPLPS